MEITNSRTIKENFKLSIQVSLNGLSFCALDQEARKILFFKNQRFPRKFNPIEVLSEIERLYKEEPFLTRTPKEVEVLFSNELYTLVPEKLFHEDSASDYLKFNAKILQTDFVAQDYIQDNLVNVYIPYTNINNFFFDTYGAFEYRHAVSVLVDEVLKLEESQSEAGTFYVNHFGSGFDLVVIQNGKLALANTFYCETKEDFIYYLLFTAEQLDLDPETFKLVLLGDIDSNSENYEIAYAYIRNISIMEISFGYIFEGGNTPPKGYQFFTLLKSLE